MNLYDKESSYDNVINLQGDLPNIKKDALSKIISFLESSDADISTLGVKISSDQEILNKNIVKAYVKNISENNYVDDFDRRFDIGKEEFLYHHVGIYGYKRKALETFIGLNQSKAEIDRKLEQMRAIENDMKIALGLIDELPISVDTQEDLEDSKKKYGFIMVKKIGYQGEAGANSHIACNIYDNDSSSYCFKNI